MDDEMQRRENQSRFQDLCNAEFVDRAATLAAAAMLAGEEEQNLFLDSDPQPNQANVAEATENLDNPTQEEREAFGDRSRQSPSYYRGPIEEVREESPTKMVLTSPVQTPIVTENELVPIQIADLPIKEPNPPQWEEGSEYEDEQQRTKVCYLVKIEELKEDGIPAYKEVNIDSDLANIKLCYSFMHERSNRRNLLRRVKGVTNFAADVFGHVSDFFGKKDASNDSTMWRQHFKENVNRGIHNESMRKLVDKYEHFHPPEEVAVLQLIWESKSKFDDQQKEHLKKEHEQKLKNHEQSLIGFEALLKNRAEEKE